jgi:hypothetical protein
VRAERPPPTGRAEQRIASQWSVASRWGVRSREGLGRMFRLAIRIEQVIWLASLANHWNCFGEH